MKVKGIVAIAACCANKCEAERDVWKAEQMVITTFTEPGLIFIGASALRDKNRFAIISRLKKLD